MRKSKAESLHNNKSLDVAITRCATPAARDAVAYAAVLKMLG